MGEQKRKRWTRFLGGIGSGLACLLLLIGIEAGSGCTTLGNTGEPPTTKPTTPTTKPVTWEGWWRDGVVYQIFLRSFKDADGDGIGDLEGLIRQLSYLNDGDPKTSDDLGVTAIWLLPIFDSPSYHGYDTTDYRKIHPSYGKKEDFQRLLTEAHRRGIKVILDFVVNHTSDKHPWFVEAAGSPTSAKRDWYVWRPDDPGWTQPWGKSPVWHKRGDAYYYGIFWQGMPDLNLEHPPAREEIFAIGKEWLRLGADGYRLDAARHITADGPGNAGQSDRPQTHAFWRDFRSALKKDHPHALLAGEVWTDPPAIAGYCKGDEFDLTFHFPLAEAIFQAVSSMTVKPFWQTVALSKEYPQPCWAPFLSNHDQQRIFSRLRKKMPMMRSATAILLTMPGTPFLYYGEELGAENGSAQNDEAKRTPMAWNASAHGGFTKGTPWTALTPYETANVTSQSRDPLSLWSLYRDLIRLRSAHTALRRGEMAEITTAGSTEGDILAYSRIDQEQRFVVLFNLSDTDHATITVTLPPSFPSSSALPIVVWKEGEAKLAKREGSTLTLSLPAYTKLILAF